MDKNSKRELESLVVAQKEQLTRYETRLKDVVTAYKGLLKEKEALESSLSALSKNEDKKAKSNEIDGKTSEVASSSSSISSEKQDNGEKSFQIQVATLMNSLATLSAEKSRMEASFQADKKQLRQEILTKDNKAKLIQEKFKQINSQSGLEVENVRSKLIVERHSREKEHNDHMVMIRELQKLLSDERHLKENLEMQLNDLKTQFSMTNSTDRVVKELSTELEIAQKKIKQYEINKGDNLTENTNIILHQLQTEMTTLKQQHAVAINNEQRRALIAEERNKKLAALHEERVANLESRLAELSTTVGSYDRLRQQDQENILKLKEKITQLSNDSTYTTNDYNRNIEQYTNVLELTDIDSIVDKIMGLKKQLLIENTKVDKPYDLTKIFANTNEHVISIEEYNNLKLSYDQYQNEIEQNNKLIENQRNHIKTLQDKVMVLNRNIDEQEQEMKNRITEYNTEIRTERDKWREMISSLETEYRGKIGQLEQQLQKQRDRSLLLLEEKENEIKTLKTSFELFVPTSNSDNNIEYDNIHDDDDKRKYKKQNSTHLGQVLAAAASTSTSSGNSGGESFHMLHYAHELARKDVEISSLRKAKYSAEASLRQAIQNKVYSQQELHNKIMNLEEHCDRLERNKSREGENLEYLKNVVLSFLITNDAESRTHMLNAIGAVLKFNQ